MLIGVKALSSAAGPAATPRLTATTTVPLVRMGSSTASRQHPRKAVRDIRNARSPRRPTAIKARAEPATTEFVG